MRILYIHQYFNTPGTGGPTRSYWISKELIKQGHEVTMLTSRRDKDKPKRKVIENINVIYLYNRYSSHMNMLQRLVSFVKFMILSSLAVLRGPKFDLIIATSTPLSIGFPALVGKKLKKTPYIFEVRDLWPEVPIQMGVLKNKHIIKLVKWFEKTIYTNAKHIVALSPGMLNGVVSSGISKEKVTMIPNMSKVDQFWPRKKNLSLISELRLSPDTFKIVYFGAMGLANAIDYIIDAAKFLNNEKGLEFVFLGGGPMESIIKKRCLDEDIINVNFYEGVSTDKLSEIVNICDISLVTFANFPILATNSPNKLFDSLSAGKPIIVNSPGWTKKIVEDNQCGLFVDPTNPKALAEQIIKLKNNPGRCEKMGINSRKLAEEQFDKSILCLQFTQLINSLDLLIKSRNQTK